MKFVYSRNGLHHIMIMVIALNIFRARLQYCHHTYHDLAKPHVNCLERMYLDSATVLKKYCIIIALCFIPVQSCHQACVARAECLEEEAFMLDMTIYYSLLTQSYMYISHMLSYMETSM